MFFHLAWFSRAHQYHNISFLFIFESVVWDWPYLFHLMGVWIWFSFLVIRIVFIVKPLCAGSHMDIFNTLWYKHMNEIAKSCGILWLRLEELPSYFPVVLYHSEFAQLQYEGSGFCASQSTHHLICLLNINHPSGYEVVFHRASDMHFSVSRDVFFFLYYYSFER